MHAFFEPAVKKKVDYVSAQFDSWKALFKSTDSLLESLVAASASGPNHAEIASLIAETRRECDDERRALESTFDHAVLQIEAGANIEDTPPMASAIPCDLASLTRWKVPDSFELDGGGDAGMSYAAAVLRPPSSQSLTQAPSALEICYQRLRDAVKRPDHYNTLENSPTTRYFILRSTCEVDILASIHFGYWSATTQAVNTKLSEAFTVAALNSSCVYLFFAFSGSDEFCGLARLVSTAEKASTEWMPSSSRAKTVLPIEWLYVKDIGFSRFKIRDQVLGHDKRPALIRDSADGLEIISTIDNRLIGRRLVHSYHDLCSQGASVLTDRTRFAISWPRLRRILDPDTPVPTRLKQVDEVFDDGSDSMSNKIGQWPPNLVNSPITMTAETSALDSANIRYFVCRPASLRDFEASLQKNAWAAGSTGGHGRLHKAFVNMRNRHTNTGHIYLFFSVWNSEKLSGMAEMTSPVNFSASPTWLPSFPDRRPDVLGEFQVKWLHVAEVAFSTFSGRVFSLSTCKGKLAELTAARDCDELTQTSDGACLHNAFSKLKQPVHLPPVTPPPSPLLPPVAAPQSLPKPEIVVPSKPVRSHVTVRGPGNKPLKGPDMSRVSFVCPICFTRGPAKPVTLPCGHVCHEGCYGEWEKRNAPAMCPKCVLREKPRRKPLTLIGLKL